MGDKRKMNKEESDLIIAEQNKSTEEILKAVAKVKSDYHELCKLKDMRIAELEEKISVLLSCKNCPENKGGLICVKEYENKCLAQKIEFIKELQEENAELKEKLKPENCLKLLAKEGYIKFTSEPLNKAKDLLKWFVWYFREGSPNLVPYKHKVEEAEQFLSEVEK